MMWRSKAPEALRLYNFAKGLYVYRILYNGHQHRHYISYTNDPQRAIVCHGHYNAQKIINSIRQTEPDADIMPVSRLAVYAIEGVKARERKCVHDY